MDIPVDNRVVELRINVYCIEQQREILSYHFVVKTFQSGLAQTSNMCIFD